MLAVLNIGLLLDQAPQVHVTRTADGLTQPLASSTFNTTLEQIQSSEEYET